MKDTVKLAASKMTGYRRRQFQAEMAHKYCAGTPRQAERQFGWGRAAVHTGLGDAHWASLPRRLLRTRASQDRGTVSGTGQRDPRAGRTGESGRTDVIEKYQGFLKTEGRAKKTLTKYLKIFERLQTLAKRRHAHTIRQVDLQLINAHRFDRVDAKCASTTVFTESVVIRQFVNFAQSRGLAR